MNDEKIIELFWERSEAAIAELDRKYGPACKKIAYNILGDERDAEECVNDSYFGVWNTIPPNRPDSLVSYIIRIVKNTSLKKLKYNMAKKRNSHYDLSLEELEECVSSSSKTDMSSKEELESAIREFLGSLDTKSRVIFLKRYWFADSLEDISKELHVSKGALKVKLFRLRKKLRETLEREEITI